jgi:hypothetical protein
MCVVLDDLKGLGFVTKPDVRLSEEVSNQSQQDKDHGEKQHHHDEPIPPLPADLFVLLFTFAAAEFS